MREQRSWVTALLVVALVAVFAFSWVFAPRPADADAEAFGGTDAAVTTLLADAGVEPWFTPVFEPASGEVEAGLFALQAALGAGVLCFALGHLHGRRRARES